MPATPKMRRGFLRWQPVIPNFAIEWSILQRQSRTVSEVSKGAVAGSAERIGAVKVYANVTQSDVTAGTKIGLGFDDGVAPVQKDSLVPAAGYVTNVYDVAPGAVDWTPAIYDASDIKIISVA